LIIFNAELVEQALESYIPELREMAAESFKDYKRIRMNENVEYDALARAIIIRNHFKNKLKKALFLDGEKNKIVDKNNTFFLYINEFPITFNKLNKDKTKCKYVDDIKMNISYNFNQLTLFVNPEAVGKTLVSEEIPLTFGYVLNPIGTEIVGFYLTYQVGKDVKWYKRIDFEEPMSINGDNNPPPPQKSRVRIK